MAMPSWNDREFDVPDMLLAGLIAEVERTKGLRRIEYDNMKHSYLAGDKQGYTKRQIEDKMLRLAGEILGFEEALSTLYSARFERQSL